jgi:hypothetical protein
MATLAGELGPRLCTCCEMHGTAYCWVERPYKQGDTASSSPFIFFAFYRTNSHLSAPALRSTAHRITVEIFAFFGTPGSIYSLVHGMASYALWMVLTTYNTMLVTNLYTTLSS